MEDQASSGAAPLLEPGGGSSSPGRAPSRWAALGLGATGLVLTTVLVLVCGGRTQGRLGVEAAAAPSLSSLAAEAATVERVRIDVYGMAGCPFTREFVEGPLSETISIASELVDLRLHAFGNSYHPTEECGGTADGMPFASYFKGYNQTVRECWDKHCGAAAKEPAKDCFSGPLVCQHGATDGMVTAAWACAKQAAGEVATKYMPFVSCTALNFLSVTSDERFGDTVLWCAVQAGLNPVEVLACAVGPQGQQLLQDEARMTVPHPSVPYVVIDGKVLDDTSCVACGDGIMQKVCEGWRSHGGKDSPACQGIFGVI